ncbi:hypothetical protein BZL30_6724 [Mycobacterium kansasii]|uniref:DoxX family protein n=1 Tax=Mycobacterium kansasii TaxID=1768 RepID=A0A1V3X5P2_MYCKA|nr:hypothetical protein BZL30_6724 [Mycobacterium kansasii]OOK74529.1 hypothetical protein BZL29_4718 [Mycobacterium kansasii]
MAATGSRRDFWRRLLHAEGPPAAICIRLLVGLVFLSEGIQKFRYPQQLGPGASSGSEYLLPPSSPIWTGSSKLYVAQ